MTSDQTSTSTSATIEAMAEVTAASGSRDSGDVAVTFCATLVDEWVGLGVRHAVVAPGSRSTPMALALVRDPRLTVEIFHDERSAGFCALGIAKATGVPAVLLCTSGTAAVHFHAAVVEAHHGAVPMLVCTADRPPELHGIGAPQTIDQRNLYGPAVRLFRDAGVPGDAGRGDWRSLARECFSAATGAGMLEASTPTPGPVQLNLPFREPLVGTAGELPPIAPPSNANAPVTESARESGERIAALAAGRRGVVIAGGGCPAAVLDLATALGWPVFADVRSGARGREGRPLVTAFDPILRVQDFAGRHRPEVVLRFGEPPASKVLGQWCAASGAEMVQIAADSRIFDPDRTVGEFLTGDLGVLAREAIDAIERGSSGAELRNREWAAAWEQAEISARGALDEMLASRWCEPAVAAAVAGSMRDGESLVVSSSMPIRDLEWFAPVMRGVTVHANRGTNGIDGVVSTAVGVAVGSRRPVTLMIGDIAFLHDNNGLIDLARRGVNLRIVVTNNDGGAIFGFLPQRSVLADAEYEALFGTPHGTDLGAMARAHGLDHVAVDTLDGLRAALAASGHGHDSVVIEARTDRFSNVAEHDAVHDAVAAAVATTLRAG